MSFQELGCAKNGLKRVIELVSDARCKQTDGGKALLSDDLTLQRLQRLVHRVLLFDPAVEGVAGLPKIRGHRRERVLQLGQLEIWHVTGRRRRQIAIGNPSSSGSEMVKMPGHHIREPQREQRETSECAQCDRQVSLPERRETCRDDRLRNTDGQHPWGAFHGRVPIQPLDAVHVGPLSRAWETIPGHRRDGGANEFIGVKASHQDAMGSIDNRDDRARRQGDRREYRLKLRQIDCEIENRDDRRRFAEDWVCQRHGRSAGHSANHELADLRLPCL